MQRIYLKNKSYSVDNLPSEPSLLVELLDLCHNDNANFEMFSTAIKKDVSLTAKILQVANSPAYRQWNELTDIRRMLIVLGLTNVRNIVTTCAIQQFFANFTKAFNKNVQFIWLRSLICANLAERIAKLVGYANTGEAFLAGLLHQVGMLLLLLNRESEYLPILDQYYLETEKFHFLEQEKLQVDHCELGAALVESWRLDSFIGDAINFQQAPAEELISSPTILKILAVAAPLSSKNSARNNGAYLEKAGLLFDMTEDTILDCLTLAVEKSQQMITDLGFSGRFYMEENEEEIFNPTQQETSQQKLAEQVENIALSNTIAKSEKVELVEFTKEIRTNFNTLFNLNQLFFFKIDETQTTLSAINDLKINKLDEIEFRTGDKNSLLVNAFNHNNCVITLSKQRSIADKQVIRLLNTEEAYLLPIYHEGTGLGVLALGTSELEWPNLQNKVPLLKLLCSEIARNYFSLAQRDSQPANMSSVDFKKVAHEISNPLTIINNYLYMLGKKIDGDHSAQEEIKFISEEIERVGNILLRAKDPKAPTKTKYRLVDINKLLTELDTLFSGSLYKTKQIESKLLLDKQIPNLYCPKDKLKQILINIIKNGVEAMEASGTIKITSRDNFYQNGQQYVEISIQDSGPGIDAEILKNLFKPVTSTKEGHSGLGLSIVNTLVQELSGNISCYSSQDHGTEFKILVPRKQDESEIELK
ncbi:MAG: HDOD domain-containing protein [Thermodesulfobacteriota bacterium]|nr:HDOD domain-containing protein [Thermodesulfobacteriota bacterium]